MFRRFIAASAVGLFTTPALAATYQVDANGVVPNSYITIADALAVATNLDTIIVHPGVYSEPVDFAGRDMVVRSSAGPGLTILEHSSNTVTIAAGERTNTVLEGFTIRSHGGRALHLGGGASPTIRNCVFDNDRGYALYADAAGDVVLEDIAVRNISHSDVIYVRNSDLMATNLVVEDTIATSRSAFYLDDGSNFTLVGGRFARNSAPRGALYVESSTTSAVVSGVDFLDNVSTTHGGAVYGSAAGRLVVTDSHFFGNEATSRGGAVYLTGGRGHLHNNTFIENEADHGGGVYNDGSAGLALLQNTFAGNAGNVDGAHAYLNSSGSGLVGGNLFAHSIIGTGVVTVVSNQQRYLLQHNTFWDNYDGHLNLPDDILDRYGNVEDDPGFAQFARDGLDTDNLTLTSGSTAIGTGLPGMVRPDGAPSDRGAGGADFLPDVTADQVVSAYRVGDHRTLSEAVAAAADGDTIAMLPGVVWEGVDFGGKDLTVRSVFGPEATAYIGTGNGLYWHSTEDAALIDGMSLWTTGSYLVRADSMSEGRITNSLIVHNITANPLYLSTGASLTLDGCVVRDNRTTQLVYTQASSFTMLDTLAEDNTGSDRSALAYFDDGSEVLVRDSIFRRNTGARGGVLYAEGTATSFTVRGSTFEENHATDGGALSVSSVTSGTRIRDNGFFGNTATNRGGALYLVGIDDGWIADNTFQLNAATTGGAIHANGSVRMALLHNTLVQNRSSQEQGAAIYAESGATTLMTGNLLAHHPVDGGPAVWGVSDDTSRFFPTHNALWDNADGDWAIGNLPAADMANLQVDPGFSAWVLDDDWRNDDLTLSPDSPLLDAAAPGLADPDGGAADIGRHGADLDRDDTGANDLVVGVPGAYTTIAEALADALDGDRIVLYPGVYNEVIGVSAVDVEITSAFGRETVALTAANGVRVNAPGTTTLSSVAILPTSHAIELTQNHHGVFTDLWIDWSRGYAFSVNTGSLSLVDSVVQNTVYTHGGYSIRAEVELRDSVFRNNHASSDGGVLRADDVTLLTATGNVFENNRTDRYGAAIEAETNAELHMERNRFSGNVSNSRGGAFYLTSVGRSFWLDNLFLDNEATREGGAGQILGNGAHLFSSNRWVDNDATSGGALYLSSSARAMVLGDTLVGNSATTSGAAIHVASGGTMQLSSSVVAHHRTTPALHTVAATARLHATRTVFWDNDQGEADGHHPAQADRYGNLALDPMFVAWSDDGDPTNDDFRPAPGSPLLDSGPAAMLAPDGSAADRGAGGIDLMGVDASGGYDHVVSPYHPGAMRTLGEALLAARNTDAVLVYPGIYPETINLQGRDVRLTSAFGADTVAITGNTAFEAISGETSAVVLDGLTLMPSSTYGIRITAGSTPSLNNSVIRFTSGHWMHATDGGFTATNLTVDDNTGSTPGYAVRSVVDIDRSSFTTNSASGDGGVLWVDDASEVTFTGCYFEGNTSSTDGGVFSLDGAAASLNISDSVFSDNAARHGGAIDTGTSQRLTLTGNTFCGNNATTNGGAVRANNVDTDIRRNVFQTNLATSGGALYLINEDHLLQNNTFVENEAPTDGSSVYGQSSVDSLDIRNNIFAYSLEDPAVFIQTGIASWTLSYNNFYELYRGPVAGTISTVPIDNLAENPQFVSFDWDGACLDDDLRLADSSLLLDAGDPSILDPDGTRSDIGAFGGGAGPVIFGDVDGDGFEGPPLGGDCNNGDPDIYPGAIEIPYDGIDQDCDGRDLDDLDMDGSAGGTGPDCDDDNPAVNPNAMEIPYDGIDQDCSGADLVDVDGDGALGGGGPDCDDDDPTIAPGQPDGLCDNIDRDCDGIDCPGEVDLDGDGYGVNVDCDDGDASIFPGAVEVCGNGIDEDCAGGDAACADDLDGDGFIASVDCDDLDAAVYPGANDPCGDGIDQDCSGDDGVCDADVDGDGFSINQGDCADDDASINPGVVDACGDGIDQDCTGTDASCVDDLDGDGFTEAAGDCDDDDAQVFPGASEICGDGTDQDCDGSDAPCVGDADGDGVTVAQGDCDDGDASIYPGAAEVCGDAIDQDCDGADVSCSVDQDGDGISVGQDCDDNDASIYPGALEICGDAVDQDCDGADSSCSDDVDGDGFTEDAGDCDDADAQIYPGAADLCGDGIDQDCLYGDQLCSDDLDGDGFTEDDGDCDDNDAASYPGAPEICSDGTDQDCDGLDIACTSDFDGDGFDASTDCDDTDADVFPGALDDCGDGIDQDCTGADEACNDDSDGDGYTEDFGDCNDADPLINPGAVDVCFDEIDQDCDGIVNLCTEDDDGDGLSELEGDCDDFDATVSPLADEECDGLDQNCNTIIDENTDCYDDDLDGYTEDDGDCDDDDDTVNPDGVEICGNDVDEDCDGLDPVCDDTDPPDTDVPIDVVKGEGCGCNGGVPLGWFWVPLIALARRRRENVPMR